MPRRLEAFLVLLSLSLPWYDWSAWLSTPDSSCHVLSVHDGDTLKLNCGLGIQSVRLACIDAPELEQKPWGEYGRQALLALTQQPLHWRSQGRDAYGRWIAWLYDSQQRSLNQQLVIQGAAAVYLDYCQECSLLDSQAHAQGQRLGIWASVGLHQRPWEWHTRSQ